MVQDHFWKNTVWTCCCQCLMDFAWPETHHHVLRTRLLEHPKEYRNNFEWNCFFAPGALGDPLLAPTVCGPSCSPAPPNDDCYAALGGSLGVSQGWGPQNVGG